MNVTDTKLSEMIELNDKDLDAVSGGFLDFLNTVTQSNTGVQVALAGGDIIQLAGQANISLI
jgi:bacteriocin-like protein